MLVDNEAKTSWPALIVIFVIAIAIGGGIYYWQSNQKVEESVQITPTVTPTATPTATVSPTATGTPIATPTEVDETAGWKTLKREKYNYQLKYPADWTYKSEKVDGSTSRVRLVFTDSAGDEMMNIENPAPEIGYEGFTEIRTKKIKIPNSNRYLTKTILMYPAMEGHPADYHALVLWNTARGEDYENSGMLTFNMSSKNDPAEKTLDKILKTFRFLD